MTIVPIRYVEPVYRPPSEADSLILPVTAHSAKCTPPRRSFRGGQPEWHVRFVAPNLLLAESRETCRIALAVAKAKGA